ncbi:unnamed protein product [Didymodactylos carnosus]|uniref:Uncharacterized protein n=1 Tax=Didymodactylos carnosus TaxID=1234261 RepID=A0A8S2EQJ7_9BILA|nr:unnamed protein product [Didymodactylos carnosus]CAF4021207.1 unnamed protein product [Didymodactylos carnosus]
MIAPVLNQRCCELSRTAAGDHHMRRLEKMRANIVTQAPLNEADARAFQKLLLEEQSSTPLISKETTTLLSHRKSPSSNFVSALLLPSNQTQESCSNNEVMVKASQEQRQTHRIATQSKIELPSSSTSPPVFVNLHSSEHQHSKRKHSRSSSTSGTSQKRRPKLFKPTTITINLDNQQSRRDKNEEGECKQSEDETDETHISDDADSVIEHQQSAEITTTDNLLVKSALAAQEVHQSSASKRDRLKILQLKQKVINLEDKLSTQKMKNQQQQQENEHLKRNSIARQFIGYLHKETIFGANSCLNNQAENFNVKSDAEYLGLTLEEVESCRHHNNINSIARHLFLAVFPGFEKNPVAYEQWVKLDDEDADKFEYLFVFGTKYFNWNRLTTRASVIGKMKELKRKYDERKKADAELR